MDRRYLCFIYGLYFYLVLFKNASSVPASYSGKPLNFSFNLTEQNSLNFYDFFSYIFLLL